MLPASITAAGITPKLLTAAKAMNANRNVGNVATPLALVANRFRNTSITPVVGERLLHLALVEVGVGDLELRLHRVLAVRIVVDDRLEGLDRLRVVDAPIHPEQQHALELAFAPLELNSNLTRALFFLVSTFFPGRLVIVVSGGGETPVPLSATVGSVGALLDSSTVAERAPGPCGAKRKETVQDLLGAIAPPQVSLPLKKSWGFPPPNESPATSSGAEPLFVSTTACGVLTVLTA